MSIASKPEKVEKICPSCESRFKLFFSLDETSGYPKFCCFCGESLFDDDNTDYLEEEE